MDRRTSSSPQAMKLYAQAMKFVYMVTIVLTKRKLDPSSPHDLSTVYPTYLNHAQS